MTSEQEIFSLYDSYPDSLLDICMDYLVANLNTITTLDPTSHWRKLKDDITLPANLCEKFIQTYQKKNRVNDNIANLFRDPSRTRLNCVKLRNSRITEEGLRCFMVHRPYSVELVQCKYLSQESLDIINEYSDRLVSLKFGPLIYDLSQKAQEGHLSQKGYITDAPNLRQLTIQCRRLPISPLLLVKPLKNLTHLDLSDFTSDISTGALHELKNLRSLSLHNIVYSKEIIDWITTLQSLRHLDLSQPNEILGTYNNPNKVLSSIVTSLPHLQSLDISGTNLAGSGAASVHARCDIPGLVSRVNNPLEFLGLYGTHHGACKRHDIPAKVISGDANGEQILTAAVAYMERPALLTYVLNDLYTLVRYENKAYVGRALTVVLDAMVKHVSNKDIQTSASASLLYIVKGREKARIGIKLKRRILSVLLDGMEAHLEDDIMMRNGCLTLCHYKLPDEVLFEYDRVIQILLNSVNLGGFAQHIAIYLLNSLPSQEDRKQERFSGNHGAIGGSGCEQRNRSSPEPA